jgi:type II secretory pathway pseudopilin PulG
VELLVAMAIFGVAVTSVYTLYHHQRAAYQTQDQILQMEQNGRAGMNLLMQELRSAGCNVMGSRLIDNPGVWVPAGFIPNSPIPVSLDANPKITRGTSAQPDMITFLSELETDNNPTTLNEAAAAGATGIVLSLNASNTISQYNIGDIVHVGTGSEYARVTEISGSTLIIDTDPAVAGNQGLTRPYPAGTPVGEISVVSYAVFNTGTDAANPVLKRKVNAAGFQPVAENISDMRFSISGSDEIKIDLTARTEKPDSAFSVNNGYRTLPFSSAIKLRNSSVASPGSH